jgi:hypothetical protein
MPIRLVFWGSLPHKYSGQEHSILPDTENLIQNGDMADPSSVPPPVTIKAKKVKKAVEAVDGVVGASEENGLKKVSFAAGGQSWYERGASPDGVEK